MARSKKANIVDQLEGIDWSNFNPENPNYKIWVQYALEHIRSNVTAADLRDSVLSWYRKNDETNVSGLNLIEEWRFHHIGRYFWLMDRGATLEESTASWIDEKMKPILAQAKELVDEKNKNSNIVKFPTNEPTPEKLGHWLAQDLEDLVLEDKLEDDEEVIYSLLRKSQPKPLVLRFAVEKMSELVNELTSLTRDEVEEGFKSEKSWKKLIESYRLLLQTLETYAQNSKRRRKASRKTRKADVRAKRLERKVENVNFKAEDTELKLVSIEPTRLLGATTALVYNAKTRKLGIYYADSDTGFEIRGTTLHGFDAKKSIQKTLRKPAEQLESFRKTTARRAEVILSDYVKAKAQILNGRLNEHIVIMQVWK